MLLITLTSPPHDRLEAIKWRKDNNIKRCFLLNELLTSLSIKTVRTPSMSCLLCWLWRNEEFHCVALTVSHSRWDSQRRLGIPLNPFLLRCSDLLSMIWFIESVEQINYETCNGVIWWPEILAYVSVGLLKVALHLYCTANITTNLSTFTDSLQPGCCLGVSELRRFSGSPKHNDLTPKSSSFRRKFRLTQ